MAPMISAATTDPIHRSYIFLDRSVMPSIGQPRLITLSHEQPDSSTVVRTASAPRLPAGLTPEPGTCCDHLLLPPDEVRHPTGADYLTEPGIP